MIDLIDHQVAAARAQCGRKRRQLCAIQHRAGGIGWRGHQRADAGGVPVALDEFGRQLVLALRADRHQLRGPFDQAQEMPVARVAGIGQQPVLARIDQQAAGQQQGTGATGRHKNAFGVYG